jgi:DHA1 family tetracycline resistance protein-like MFS transporter
VGPPLYSLVFNRFHGVGALAQVPTMPFLLAGGFSLVTLLLFLRGLALTKATPAP